MSPSASVAFEFVRIQNGSETNGRGVNGSNNLEYGPGKQLAKARLQDLSRVKPQMMQKVLSSIGLTQDKQSDLVYVNHQPAKGFNGRSEAFNHAETMELFPVSTDFGLNTGVNERNFTVPSAISQTGPVSGRSVPAKSPEQQSTCQLVIIYNGMVNVYNVPTEKAEAIIRLAGSISSSKTRTPQINISKIKEIFRSKPAASNADNEDRPESLPIGLEIVPKLSVQRFLQKRKERINRVAPYTTMKPATLPWKAGKDSEDQIILSLACPSQGF